MDDPGREARLSLRRSKLRGRALAGSAVYLVLSVFFSVCVPISELREYVEAAERPAATRFAEVLGACSYVTRGGQSADCLRVRLESRFALGEDVVWTCTIPYRPPAEESAETVSPNVRDTPPPGCAPDAGLAPPRVIDAQTSLCPRASCAARVFAPSVPSRGVRASALLEALAVDVVTWPRTIYRIVRYVSDPSRVS